MKSSHCHVALLDVLAYRNHIKNDENNGNEIFKEKLNKSLDILNNINETELSINAISDTIIITANSGTSIYDFLSKISEIQGRFLVNELLIRGGISFGKHFRNNRLTYSHALTTAYDIEQKHAIYPRIVIDKNIIEMFTSGTKYSQEDKEKINNENLICTQNGVYFINFANKNNIELYKASRNIYNKEKTALREAEQQMAKHRWLQDYIHSQLKTKESKYIEEISNYQIV